MTEIRDTGSIQYTNTTGTQASQQRPVQDETAPPQDQVSLQNERSIGQKLVQIPSKILKGIAGGVVGTASAAMHVLPGAGQGLSEATTEKSSYYRPKPGRLVASLFGQNILAGGGAGFMVGGLAGAAIGVGVAVVATGILTLLGDKKQEMFSNIAENIHNKVNHALEDNKGTKTEVAFQNATEGTIVGAVEGAKGGWKSGFSTGEATVSAVADTVEGVLEGVYEFGKNVVKGLPERKDKDS